MDCIALHCAGKGWEKYGKISEVRLHDVSKIDELKEQES